MYEKLPKNASVVAQRFETIRGIPIMNTETLKYWYNSIYELHNNCVAIRCGMLDLVKFELTVSTIDQNSMLF